VFHTQLLTICIGLKTKLVIWLSIQSLIIKVAKMQFIIFQKHISKTKFPQSNNNTYRVDPLNAPSPAPVKWLYPQDTETI